MLAVVPHSRLHVARCLGWNPAHLRASLGSQSVPFQLTQPQTRGSLLRAS